MYRGPSRPDPPRPKRRPPVAPPIESPAPQRDPVVAPETRPAPDLTPPVVSRESVESPEKRTRQPDPRSDAPSSREPAPPRERRRGWTGRISDQGFRGDGVVRDLHHFRGARLTGTREEARRQRSLDRRSRSERIDSVMWTLGVYRAVSRRAIVASCFDGHSFAANPVLAKLVSDGLVDVARVSSGRYAYQVFGLSALGADWLRDHTASAPAADRLSPDRKKEKKKKSPWDDFASDQRVWQGRLVDQQLRHDHQVFEAVAQDAESEVAAGGRIRRVRLDSEVRGLLASADAVARRRGGPQAAVEARCTEGRRLGLTVFEEGAPIPDALVEIERRDGTVLTRAIEVATSAYTTRQLADKVRAGFQVYRVPNSHASGRRRRSVFVEADMQLISWSGR